MEFKTYYAELLKRLVSGGPRADEALRDYRAMQMNVQSSGLY